MELRKAHENMNYYTDTAEDKMFYTNNARKRRTRKQNIKAFLMGAFYAWIVWIFVLMILLMIHLLHI